MACLNCNSTSPVSIYDIQYLYSQNTCNSCNDPECGGNNLNSKCVYYAGPNLVCSDIESGDTLEVVIQKLDAQLCAITGDYSLYNTACLSEITTITTEQQFVETISAFVCTLRDDFDLFVGTTFVTYQTTVDTRFDLIEIPGTTSCVFVGINVGDTLQTVLQKLSNAVCDIADNQLDISTVDWDQCFVVAEIPDTIAEGFDLVIDQLCSIKADLEAVSSTLPTFNNTTSCLASPGTTDSLVDTINKIKDRLCLTPTFNINTLTWNCLTKPSSTATDLQAAFQTVLNAIDDLKAAMPTFDSGDFIVTPTNISDECEGKTVALATPIDQDRYVAVNVGDASPGTLVEKLTAGTNITLDTTTTPGTMIINSSGGTAVDEKVKAFSSDPFPSSFLNNKVEGDTNDGITISTSNNLTLGKVTFTPSIDWSIFIPALVDAINNDPDLKEIFCALVSSCPSPCEPPTNVQAVAL